MSGSIPLLNHEQIQLTIKRIAREVIENHDFSDNSVLIGLQPRGVLFGQKIRDEIQTITGKNVQYGELDITFYRDDFRTRDLPLEPSSTQIDFSIQDKKVVMVDDVLYTGRSVRAALDALLDFGRPKQVEFMVLVDRRFSRHLPIQADYVGKSVDSIESERVSVNWTEKDFQVNLYTPKV
jgi:pyrimidine operon attenuation protein/uracil phosphoribosyltransferase